MLTLCIETSTPAVSIAIGDENGVLASLDVQAGRRHAETLMPATDALLRFLQRDRGELTHVGVDVGPGLFTGLRVGVATAKGLSLALGIGVVPINSLELLAASAVHDHDAAGRLVTLLDARRGELYAAVFETRGNALVNVVDPLVAPRDEALDRCGALADATVIGEASVAPHDAGARTITRCRPNAPTLAVLLAAEHAGGRLDARTMPGDHVELVYLRASDAEIAAAAKDVP